MQINPGMLQNTGKTAKMQPQKTENAEHADRQREGKSGKSGRAALSGMVWVTWNGLLTSPTTYHYGRTRYIINSEKYFTCSQHVRFTFVKSSEYHTCIDYMGGGGGGCRSHVGGMICMYELRIIIDNIFDM